MGEKLLAGLGLLVCAVLGLRMLLSDHRVRRFDARVIRQYAALKLTLKSIPHWWRSRDSAKREASRAIDRAKGQAKGQAKRPNGTTNGLGNGADHDNVIRPRFGDKKDD